jgi:arylsulfatase A-like enzyme
MPPRTTLFTLVFALAAAAQVAAAEQPNVVYFLIDDLGRNDCGFMGGKEIKTPRIDALAAEGAVLDAFYVQPLCSPTRAAFMTGRYPLRYGLQVGVVKPWAKYGLPLDETTVADDLKAAGYATAVIGKWHLGHFEPEYLPLQRGFTRQYGHYNGALDYFSHKREGGHDWHSNDKANYDEGYATTLIGEKAAEFVTETAGKQPFLLYVPFNAVHSPYQPPKDSKDEYPNLKGTRKDYASMLTETDHAIGQVVDAVEAAGAMEDTIFIFSSDNGGPEPGKVTDNGKYRGGKGGLYEGGVRVAAFAAWQGHIPAGSTVKEPMHVVDVRPTLLKLCGAEQTGDKPLDGRDVSAVFAEGAESPHDAIVLNATPQEAAIRAGDWKLIERYKDRPRAKRRRAAATASVELYNLQDDPYEKSNLAEANPEKVAELQAKLKDLTRDSVPPKAEPEPKSFDVPKIWGEAA